MVRTIIERTTQLSSNQSVVLIIEDNAIPSTLNLSKSEEQYASGCFESGDRYAIINSYTRCIYLVELKDDTDHDKVREHLRQTAYLLKEQIRSNCHNELVIASSNDNHEAVIDFTEAYMLSIYEFDKYKTPKEEKKHYPSKLLLYSDILDKEMAWLNSMIDAVWFVRDMINEPVSVMNTLALAKEVSRYGKESGFSTDILNDKQIRALQMGGLLAVNKGSVDPPVFCILEWNPDDAVNTQPVVLVGKGIVYDTGGLNLKIGDHMADMKGDMAGAATVIGIMYVVAKNRLPFHVVGLIPSTDNRPGGNAYTQGDIITMFNKKSVEVQNTDAEGRLILADAISYASKYKPELIIDIATLTGSAVVTFGNKAIAMMSNADRKYVSLLSRCGFSLHERVAELPFWDEYEESIKSNVADLKNVGNDRAAGTITAGKFLESFAEYPFIHLDIAGTGLLTKDDYYRLKPFPGSGLRLLATFLRELSKNYNELK